ncbi:MAG: tail fiber domain-containing protein [Saprospiraceae bacterium]|nr:tail fiber domain-containing protein [Candidatus Defluviibacterium haderslevense]
MKKLTFIFLTLLVSIGAFAQPNKMSFQAVIRNANGQLVSNTNVGIRLLILKGSEFGAAVFVETHVASTNANGLASFEIGGGTNVTGSIASIDWASGPYFLKTETDPNGGSNYSISGTSQMLSVPYALYAGSGVKGDKGDKGDQGLPGIKGDKGDPGLQGSKGDDGSPGIKGEKGDKGDKGDVGMEGQKGEKGDQGLQGVKGDKGDKGDVGNPGSANINGTTGYIIKFNGPTSGDNSIIRQENNIININNPSGTGGKLNVKGVSGGYGIHGESDFIGVQGEGNIGVYGNGTGGGVGVKGNSSSSDGVQGVAASSGDGVQGTSSSGNGVRGTSTSGYGIQGTSTSGDGLRGSSSSADGVQGTSTTGAGGRFGSTSGAGVVIEVATNKLALLANYGDVFIGTGNIGIGTTAFNYKLQLGTNSAAKPTTNTWTVASDARLKKDIISYKDGLSELLKINPVWFTYNGQGGMPNETGVGVLAQELQKIAPYMVNKWIYKKDQLDPGTEYLGVDNGSMTYMLINAIKEQQQMIESLNQQIDAKNKMFESFQTKLDALYSQLKLEGDAH